jgi:hypothetical protein
MVEAYFTPEGTLTVVTWTYGVMEVYSQFRQHASSNSLQLTFGQQ